MHVFMTKKYSSMPVHMCRIARRNSFLYPPKSDQSQKMKINCAYLTWVSPAITKAIKGGTEREETVDMSP